MIPDGDGVIVVPQELAPEVLIKIEEMEVAEEGTRTDLLAGLPWAEVVKKYGRL